MFVDKACVFRLGESFFAFPGQDVQEVTEIGKFSPVPRSSAVLLGLLTSRGLIYPLLDLGLQLKQDNQLLSSENALGDNEFLSDINTPKKLNKVEFQQQSQHALVVRDGEGEVALAVDEVIGYESQVSTDDSDMSFEIAAAFGPDTTSETTEGYPSYYQGDVFYYLGQEVKMLKLAPLLDVMTIEVV